MFKEKYKLSFTAASLFLHETVKIAEMYVQERDWKTTEQIVLDENLLQKNKRNTAKREFSELKLRLKNLTNEQIKYLVVADYTDQMHLIYLAVCKTYKLISDFVIEVIRNQYLQFNTIVDDIEYDKFFEIKEESHQEIDDLSDSSKKKIKQVMFKILTEVKLLSSIKDKIIFPILLNDKLEELIIQDDSNYLKLYLISDIDIKERIKNYE